uniref:Saposin B-type domain-containing protein n=1 Tax=Panagrellus redivivus TaxID=6233 RepID=A0A7E4WBK0_PANRE
MYFKIAIVAAFFLAFSAAVSLNAPNGTPKMASVEVSANCSACQTIYSLALQRVNLTYLATEASTKTFLFGECNMFRHQEVPFWPYCFELYTNNFQGI